MKDIAQISRDKMSKNATLTVVVDAPWKLFISDSNEKNPLRTVNQPILAGEGPAEAPVPVDPLKRNLFQLEVGETIHTIAENHLPMTGGYNIRDLGGYRGAGGRRVVWNTFFRSDDMAHLTDEDVAYLGSIPIRSVFDFRTEIEVAEAPDRLPETVRTIIHEPLAPGNVDPAEIHHGVFSAYRDTTEFMHAVYHELVTVEKINAVYRRLFALFQDDSALPVLFHCTAGKDRTGVATAFLLLALGVDRDTVIADYLLSNVYLEDKYADLALRYPQLATLYSVQPAYLNTALASMEQHSGTIDRYLQEVLEIDIEAFRARFLY